MSAVPASAAALPARRGGPAARPEHHREPLASTGRGSRPAVARATDFAVLLSLVAAGAGLTLVPELAARNLPAGVRLLAPAEPVTRQIFTISRRGGDRKPAVRVVLDALAEAAQDRPAAA